MNPGLPKENLFGPALRNLGVQAREFGALIFEYRYYIGIGAAILLVILFIAYRNSRSNY